MTTAQVVETSVTVTNSSFQNYNHPDDHTRQTKEERSCCTKSTFLHSINLAVMSVSLFIFGLIRSLQILCNLAALSLAVLS